MTHSVTAIIPTIGRGEAVRAVRSVLAQSHPTLPLVVVAWPEVADAVKASLAGEGLEARMIVADSRLNGSEARNLGVASCDSDLVAFLDDDDWWADGKIERQVSALAAEPDRRAVSSCAARLVRDGDPSAGRIAPGVPYRHGRAADYLLARPRPRYGHQFMQTSCVMGWRETFVAIPWDASLAKHQDWDLLIRLFDGAGMRHAFVPEPLAFIAGNSANSVSRAPRWEGSLEWLETVAVGARARNDFVLSVAAMAAIRSRSGAGAAACVKALRPALPHYGAVLAVGYELAKAAIAPFRH